jgi:hypothetical protein
VKVSLEKARAAKRSAAARGLASRPQVNGIGISKGADGYMLKVNLISNDGERVPDEIMGVPVSIDVVGRPYPA